MREKRYHVAVLPDDGIGPEVTEAVKALTAAADLYGFELSNESFDAGAER
jgi:isocitrate/isopropylmalate dehydrogenase